MADFGEILKKIREMNSAKLHDMPPEKLIEYERYFAHQLLSFGLGQKEQQFQQLCQAQLGLIKSETARRSLIEQSERQHQQLLGTDKKVLSWSRIAGVGAILLIVIAVFSLIHDIYFSTVQPATSPQSSLLTPRQSQSPTSVSPEPEASSNSATPSPEQAMTVQPLPTTPPLTKEH